MIIWSATVQMHISWTIVLWWVSTWTHSLVPAFWYLQNVQETNCPSVNTKNRWILEKCWLSTQIKHVSSNLMLPLFHCLCNSLHSIYLYLSSCASLRMLKENEHLIPLDPHFPFVLFYLLVIKFRTIREKPPEIFKAESVYIFTSVFICSGSHSKILENSFDSNNRNSFSHTSGDSKSEIKMLAGLVSG